MRSSRVPSPHSTRARAAPPGGGFLGEPNPLLVRELRQALRLPRLPWTITAAVALIGLGMLTIGSLQVTQGKMAQLGSYLFQGFVSIVLLYVCLVGPATAAGAIALEREGKTLEPLLLTSLAPKDIARGKFLAAFATLGVQVVALLPLAAIPFLFGGVTAGELCVVAVVITAVAAVSVAFGLAIASRTQTLRGALAVSIILPAAGAPLLFGLVTAVGETVASSRWPLVTSGPIWWSTAYTTVPFGLDYVVWLLVWPLLLLGLPFWLFSALSAANLSGVNDDRSSGVKRWFLGASLLLSGAVFVTCFRVDLDKASVCAFLAEIFTFILLVFMAVTLTADPLGPTRLVRARWKRLRTSAFSRMLGPGIIRGAILQIVLAAVILGACYAGGVLGSSPGALRDKLGIASTSRTPLSAIPGALANGAIYVLLFQVFLVGLSAFLRSRKRGGENVAFARAATLAAAVVITIVPWIVATIVNSFSSTSSNAPPLVAAPSPAFAAYAFLQAQRGTDVMSVTVASLSASMAWGALGLVLLGIAWERSRRTVADVEQLQKRTEAKLDREAEEEPDEEEDEEPTAAPPPPPPLPRTAAAEISEKTAASDPDDEPDVIPPPPPLPRGMKPSDEGDSDPKK